MKSDAEEPRYCVVPGLFYDLDLPYSTQMGGRLY